METKPPCTSRSRQWAGFARAGAIAFVVLALQACSVELYTDLDQKQANEIVATLMRHGIPAQREMGKEGKMTVSVQQGRFADAMAILSENGLPKDEFANLGEVFKRDGLISSPTEERAAMIYGLSQELSRTISDIDGVLSARVHLVLPENDTLRRGVVPSSASVFMRHRASVPMSDLIPQVKMLVAKGVAGLTYDNVSVTLIPVETTPAQAGNEAGFTTFIGLWIHPDSLGPARWLVFGLIGIALALGAWAVSMHMQRRRGTYVLPLQPLPAKKP